MNKGGRIVQDIQRMLALFAAECPDRTTLDGLADLTQRRGPWAEAHGLFSEIRRKSKAAHRERDSLLVAQYEFEEVCAKTLYNIGGNTAPFDIDSPYWVVPSALLLARSLNISEGRVLDIVVR